MNNYRGRRLSTSEFGGDQLHLTCLPKLCKDACGYDSAIIPGTLGEITDEGEKEMEKEIQSIIIDIREYLLKSEVGKWILERIDEALEIGIEVEEELRQGLYNESPNNKVVFYRQPKDDMETLEVYINVLESYMVSLPLSFKSACNYLEHNLGVQRVRVSLRSEYAPQVIDEEQKFTYWPEELFPNKQNESNQQLFNTIREIMSQLKK